MTDILVVRGPGTKPGEDILEPLLSELSVALARGATALDEASTNVLTKNIRIPYQSGVELGQLVEFDDLLTGELARGKIESISAYVDLKPPAAYLNITLLVPV